MPVSFKSAFSLQGCLLFWMISLAKLTQALVKQAGLWLFDFSVFCVIKTHNGQKDEFLSLSVEIISTFKHSVFLRRQFTIWDMDLEKKCMKTFVFITSKTWWWTIWYSGILLIISWPRLATWGQNNPQHTRETPRPLGKLIKTLKVKMTLCHYYFLQLIKSSS